MLKAIAVDSLARQPKQLAYDETVSLLWGIALVVIVAFANRGALHG